MKTEHHNIDEALIGLYLSGNANAEEKNQLESGMNVSDENQKEFLRFKKLWKTAQVEENTPSFNVDAAWDKVQNKINNKRITNPLKSIVKKNNYWFSAAATLILILAISIYYYRLSNIDEKETSFIARNDMESFFLPDSSEIILTKGSVLTFTESFNKTKRKTSLDGIALFKVRKNPARTFIVKTEMAEISVLGTEFVVFSSKDSTAATVSTGKVKISLVNDTINRVFLTSGMQASVSKNHPDIFVRENKSNEERFAFDKTLIFNQTSLSEVIEILKRLYKVQIVLGNEKLGNCQLTATFKDESIKNILEVISTTFNLNLTEEGAQYILSGEAC